jgi:hypothetical protein
MEFLMIIHADENGWNALTPEQQQAGAQAYFKYADDLREKGQFVGSNRLRPVKQAKTVRLQNGKAVVTDGPFAESKEQIGGYYVIKAADIQEAVKIAEKCPGASHGVVEVRPIWEMGAAAGQ